ncbi:MAG: hypothetical protein V3U60_07500, partial [Gammaproteobacteria bacterium]
ADGTFSALDRDLLRIHLADPLGVPLDSAALARCRVFGSPGVESLPLRHACKKGPLRAFFRVR